MIVWGLLEIALLESASPKWYPFNVTWFLAIILESILFGLSAANNDLCDSFDRTKAAIWALRVLLLVTLFAFNVVGHMVLVSQGSTDEESSRLLGQDNTDGYGSFVPSDDDSEWGAPAHAAQKRLKERMAKSGSWWGYAKEYSVGCQWLLVDERLSD